MRKTRFMRFLLTYLFSLSFLYGEKKGLDADLAKLGNGETAFLEVERLFRADDSDVTVKRAWVFRAPQRNGVGLTAVLADWKYDFEEGVVFEWDYEIENREGLFEKDRPEKLVEKPTLRRIEKATIKVYDPEGKEVEPFAGNVGVDHGYVFDFNGDGVLDRAERWNSGAVAGFVTQVFLVGTIEQSPRRLLEVIYNCHPTKDSEANSWDFRCFDEEGDGFVEIGFGPEGSGLDQVVFAWDVLRGEYRVRGDGAHPHLRILGDREDAAELAREFRYPLLRKDREVVPKSGPYRFVSLKGAEHGEYQEFFNGRRTSPDPDPVTDVGDWRDDEIPVGFWERDPKEMALALVEENRNDEHRAEYQLAVDDRNGAKPPEAGWIFYGSGKSGFDSIVSSSRALKFGEDDSAIIVTEWASVGDRASHYLFDQSHRVRRIGLSAGKAKHLADIIFWLDRIRSRKSDGGRAPMMFAGAYHDGFGNLSIFEKGKKPREMAVGSIWRIGSVRGHWNGSYTRDVMLNFVDLIWRDGLREILKGDDAWPHKFDSEKHRADLVGGIRGVLEEGDSLPVGIVKNLVEVMGDQDLTELEPEIEVLEQSISDEASAEEKELEQLRAEVLLGSDVADPFTISSSSFERRMELDNRLRFDRGWVLRNPLKLAREKFELFRDPKKLREAVMGNGPYHEWASFPLYQSSVEDWSIAMRKRFEGGKDYEKERIFHEMAVVDPKAAEELVGQMDEEEMKAFFFPIMDLRLKNFPAKTREMLPQLKEILENRSQNIYRRERAFEIVSAMDLERQEEEAFRRIIKSEVAEPQQKNGGAPTTGFALKALANLKIQEGDLEYFWSQPSFLLLEAEEGLAILKKHAPDEDDFQKMAIKYLKLQLTEGAPDAEKIAWLGLSMGLRELAPLLEDVATEHSKIPDGESGSGFRWQKFHLPRYVAALWRETDEATLARMWIDFMAGQFERLDEKSEDVDAFKRMAREAVQVLDADERARWIDEALSHHNFRYHGKMEVWLRSLK